MVNQHSFTLFPSHWVSSIRQAQMCINLVHSNIFIGLENMGYGVFFSICGLMFFQWCNPFAIVTISLLIHLKHCRHPCGVREKERWTEKYLGERRARKNLPACQAYPMIKTFCFVHHTERIRYCCLFTVLKQWDFVMRDLKQIECTESVTRNENPKTIKYFVARGC